MSKKGLSAAISQGDKLVVSLQKYLEALYINAVDQSGIKKTIDYLERNKNYAYVKDIAIDTAEVFQNQRNLKHHMFIIKKYLKRKNKFRGENACMNFFEKGVIIILTAVTLSLGLVTTFTVEQSEAYHQLSDRNQT